jgi:hypothetical protein
MKVGYQFTRQVQILIPAYPDPKSAVCVEFLSAVTAATV